MFSSYLRPSCHIPLPYITVFDIKVIHQRIQIKLSHASHLGLHYAKYVWVYI